MRVLLITRGPPYPLNSGGAQRTNAILRALAKHNEVTLACALAPSERPAVEAALGSLVTRYLWIDPEQSATQRIPTTGPRLARFAKYLADFLTHVRPFGLRQATSAWSDQLRPVLAEADLIVCRHADVYSVAEPAGHHKIVLDADDLLYRSDWQAAFTGEHGLGSVLFILESLRGYFAEQLMSLRSAQTLVASSSDGARLITRRKTLIANGVNFDPAPRTTVADPGHVVFVGDCGWEPNVFGLEWFVREVWPKVRAGAPEVRLTIVGRSANRETLPFANVDGIALAENVPSVRPWLESAIVSVVPLLRGAGTRIKIIESLGYGTPVVATPVGAAGLTDTLRPEHGLIVARDAGEMASAILRVLADPDAITAAARSGSERVRAQFAWDVTTTGLASGLGEWGKGLRPKA